MARTFIRQDGQIRQSDTYTDDTAPSEANYETNANNVEDDLNNLRSHVHNLLKRRTGNWYDGLVTPSALEAGTQRGIDGINADLHAVEKKRVLREVPNLSVNILVPASSNLVILAAAELPTNTIAAIGTVTTLGTPCAYASSFSAEDLAEVAGLDALNPANRTQILDATTGDPIISGGRVVYGLLQSESNTDGSTLTGSASNRARIQFVRPNGTYDDLEVCPAADIAGKTICYYSRERVRFEDLNEYDFLHGTTIDAITDESIIYSDVELIGTKDGSNQTFTTPIKFDREDFKEILLFNGVRQREGVDSDYIVYESGGAGTGYDTIVMAVAPNSEDKLLIDYQVKDGGYVAMKPENIPMLEYSSASVMNVQSKPGRSTSLLATLSNGLQYAATSPLTMNMATSGLGGLEASASEASSTWYYLYLVPSATDGQFDVIASPNDPETGPADYSIYKYIGAVRNDASSNFLDFEQVGDYFSYLDKVNPGSLTADSTYNTLDINNSVPKTCKLANLIVYNTHATSNTVVRPVGSTTNLFYSGSGIYYVAVGGVPTPAADKEIEYTVNSGGSGIIYVTGWTDGYLD